MSHRGRYSVGGGGGAMVSANAILNREPQYRNGIKENHTQSLVLAENLAMDGTLEQCMLQAAADSSQEDINAFLQEQRKRLKLLAETRVSHNRQVDAFVDSIRRGVIPHIQQTMQTQDDEDDKPDEQNYEDLIRANMQAYHDSHKDSYLDFEDEEMCREICTRLGEKPNREGDNDDDLEIVGGESTQNLTCPVTGTLFEDPVRNKMCGHVYSRAGIMQTIRLRKACPVPGCANGRVTLEQLEEDRETVLKVRRQIRRNEMELKQRQSQAIQEMSDDDEEEAVL